jgi:diaminopimelate epimerase
VEDVKTFPSKIRDQDRNHDLFPNRTNDEFVQILNEEESSSGQGSAALANPACGTGASRNVGRELTKRTARSILVHLTEGTSHRVEGDDNHVFLAGPA